MPWQHPCLRAKSSGISDGNSADHTTSKFANAGPERPGSARFKCIAGPWRRQWFPEFDLHLVLAKPAQQADLQYLIARQQEPTAAEYHRWPTPQQFGERFGTAQQDIAAISTWLQFTMPTGETAESGGIYRRVRFALVSRMEK